MNERFLTNWVDEHNQPVETLTDFTDQVLSIPQAHKMVTQYTVIDSIRKSLILLRPYQIHAIERVREATKHQVSGYVWHTTGSGKTLTAYKVARNLLQIPSIDKTIFIVDRVDLDQQTTSSFMAYAENDTIDIDETEHVRDLIKKLKSTERTVIVTTIQKLNFVMRRFADKQGTRDYERLTKLLTSVIVLYLLGNSGRSTVSFIMHFGMALLAHPFLSRMRVLKREICRERLRSNMVSACMNTRSKKPFMMELS